MFQEIDDQLQRSLFSEMPFSRWKTNCLSIITQILSLYFVQITFPRLTLLRIQRWNLHRIFRYHSSSVIFEKHSSFIFLKIFVSLSCSSFSSAAVKKCIYRSLYLLIIWKKTRLNYSSAESLEYNDEQLLQHTCCFAPIPSSSPSVYDGKNKLISSITVFLQGATRNYMNVRLALPRNQRNRRFQTDKLANLYVNRFQYI